MAEQFELVHEFLKGYNNAQFRSESFTGGSGGGFLESITLGYQPTPGAAQATLTIAPMMNGGRPVLFVQFERRDPYANSPD